MPGAIKKRLAVAIAKLIDRRAFTGIRATPADMGGGVTDKAQIAICAGATHDAGFVHTEGRLSGPTLCITAATCADMSRGVTNQPMCTIGARATRDAGAKHAVGRYSRPTLGVTGTRRTHVVDAQWRGVAARPAIELPSTAIADLPARAVQRRTGLGPARPLALAVLVALASPFAFCFLGGENPRHTAQHGQCGQESQHTTPGILRREHARENIEVSCVHGLLLPGFHHPIAMLY